MQLVLASSSRYRRALPGRLGIPFSVADPEVVEGARPGEAPEGTARRLAEAKSLAVANRFRDALIIGCDQVAVGNGEVLGKPGTRENAVRQLRALSGSEDRKSTRLNSSHDQISYAVFCLKKKKTTT